MTHRADRARPGRRCLYLLALIPGVAVALAVGCGTSSTVTTAPTQIRCQLSFTAPSIVDASGGTSTFTVTTQPECGWDAAPAADWISGVSPTTGQGTRNVEFRVAPNEGIAPREGDIVVKGERVRVSQRASCRFDVGPSSLSMIAAGGQGRVTVAAMSDCGWTATTNVSWISLTSPVAGSGNGTVNFTVAPNGSAERSGSIIVGGQRSTITQAGTTPTPAPSPGPGPVPAPVCSYTIASAGQNISAAGGTGAPVSVSTASGCQWTASSNVVWIAVTSGASGSGNGSVGFNVAANTGGLRTGTLTIAGQGFTVTQAACSYTIAPMGQSFDSFGGVGTPVTVSTLSACQWTARSNAPWISLTSGASGSGTGPVGFSVFANTGDARSGTLTIAGLTFTVAQAAPRCRGLSISPTDQTFGASGGGGTINVSVESGCEWTAVSNAPWISIQSGVTGSGTSRVSYSVEANSGGSRSATISIAGQTFSVSQTAASQ